MILLILEVGISSFLSVFLIMSAALYSMSRDSWDWPHNVSWWRGYWRWITFRYWLDGTWLWK